MPDSPSEAKSETLQTGSGFSLVKRIPRSPKHDPENDKEPVDAIRPGLFRAIGRVVADFSTSVLNGSLLPQIYEATPPDWQAFTDKFLEALAKETMVEPGDLTWFKENYILVPHFQRPEVDGTKTYLHIVIPDATPDPLTSSAQTSPLTDQHVLELGFRVLGGCFH